MIQEFINYQQKVKNLSGNTLRSYETDLKSFTHWAAAHELRWSTIEQQHITDYMAELHDRGKRPATIKRHLSAIRNCLAFAMHQGWLTKNAAFYVESPKLEDTLPQAADEQQIVGYLSNEPRTEQSEVIHALVALLYETGLRIQEALDLRLEDFDPVAHTIRIHGKGRKERIVGYGQRTIEHCVRIAGRYGQHLFPAWGQETMRFRFYAELRAAHTHPHAIRHLWATKMLTKGANINNISLLMGHKSVKTTERYAKLTNSQALNDYNTKFYGREETK